MISQGLIINGSKALMVKQFVQRGDIVWNFPGGGIEAGETPEETGYDIAIIKLIHLENNKYTYLANVIGGQLSLNKENPANSDLIDNGWVEIEDIDKWDGYTPPILKIYQEMI